MIHYSSSRFRLFLQYSDEKPLLVQAVKELVKDDPGAVLEIGSGPIPCFSRALAKTSQRYVLLEPNELDEPPPDSVVLKRKQWEHFHAIKKYDTVLASHVTAYFSDKKKEIDRMYDALKKGGRLVIIENGLNSDFHDVLNEVAILEGYFGVNFNLPHVRTALMGKDYEEQTVDAFIRAPDAKTLFQILLDEKRITHQQHKEEIIKRLEKFIIGTPFHLENRLLVVQK